MNHKQIILLDYAKKYGPELFIETGTFRGDTIKAMLLNGNFKGLWTIDTERDRAEHAQKRFSAHSKVHCLYGDSGLLLPQIMSKIHEPALFWLDAHYSGTKTAGGIVSTPIEKELDTVLNHEKAKKHIILIDDARWFIDWSKKYPQLPTLDKLRDIVLARFPDWIFEIENDIIRTHHP